MFDLIELMFFAYRDFVGDADHLLAALRLWPGASPGLAFRQPAARPHHRRIAGYSENHQAESQSRAQGIARSGLCRGDARARKTAASANLYPTRADKALAMDVAVLQSKRFAAVFATLPEDARANAIGFLLAMVDAERAGQSGRHDRCRPGFERPWSAPVSQLPHDSEPGAPDGASERAGRPPTMPRIFLSSMTTAASARSCPACLSEQGYRVTTAGDAAEAMACLKNLAFDLIVLDVMMPGENGFDFAARLRRQRAGPRARPDPDADGPQPKRKTGCAASRPASTIISASPMSRASCRCGSPRSCAGRQPRAAPGRR